MTSREFPDPDHILLLNDHLTVYVTPDTWDCPSCHPAGNPGYATTVDWLNDSVGPDGRCRSCGLKMILARVGESVPPWNQQR